MKLLSRQEEMVLLSIWRLGEEAYGVTIREFISKITGKYCNTNAILICRELERVMKKLFTGSENQCRTFYEKMQWIIGKKGLPDECYLSVSSAWKTRNAIVHAEKNATKQDALDLLECLEIFQSVS